MSIVGAFNKITEKLGGTPARTLNGAIDALSDALAGSDQEAASSVEGAIRLLGQHIGAGESGGGAAEYNINCYTMEDNAFVQSDSFIYEAVYDASDHRLEQTGPALTKATAGTLLIKDMLQAGALVVVSGWDPDSQIEYPASEEEGTFVMPAHDVCVFCAEIPK